MTPAWARLWDRLSLTMQSAVLMALTTPWWVGLYVIGRWVWRALLQ
jgi:hypothetical protein